MLVAACYKLLTPQQRRLLQRHFIEGDSVRRIAAATGVPQHQLRKSIRAALQLLQRWAEQDGLLRSDPAGRQQHCHDRCHQRLQGIDHLITEPADPSLSQSSQQTLRQGR